MCLQNFFYVGTHSSPVSRGPHRNVHQSKSALSLLGIFGLTYSWYPKRQVLKWVYYPCSPCSWCIVPPPDEKCWWWDWCHHWLQWLHWKTGGTVQSVVDWRGCRWYVELQMEYPRGKVLYGQWGLLTKRSNMWCVRSWQFWEAHRHSQWWWKKFARTSKQISHFVLRFLARV